MTCHFLDAEARATFAQARIDALRTIGRLATSEAAAFVVVAGDVFETSRVAPRTVRRALEAMGEIPVPVFLLPGNHDPLDAASVYRSPTFERARPGNVVVLDSATPVEAALGVEVAGAPWPTKRPLTDLVGTLCAGLDPADGVTRIVVGHGAVDELLDFDSPAAIVLSTVEQAISDGRVQYVALGDRHSTTAVGSTGRVWYAGTPEPTAHDEVDPGNVLLVDVDASTCNVTTAPVGSWRFADARFELAGDADLDGLEAWLAGQVAKDRTVIRLNLRGSISLSQDARLQGVIDEAREVFGGIEDWDPSRNLIVRPDDDDFSDIALTSFAQKAVERLRATAMGDGPDARAARDGLGLLVRLAKGQAATGQ
jgi:DNA repair exonuclease SbcCD nuclease subunit